MTQNLLRYLHKCFEKLVSECGFRKVNEVNDGATYWVEYSGEAFGVKLEKYRREFYATLHKMDKADDEISLFNLISYLNRDFSGFEYFHGEFHSEKELEEYYRNQLKHISRTIYDNYLVICDFFKSSNYESRVADLEKFVLNRNPELFRKS